MTKRLFDAFYVWVGWIRGGLCAATVLACAAFAAVCGSGAATAATIGKVAYPQMKRYNYDDSLSTGCIAAAGTLGPLIPPSGTLVIYAVMTEQSITKCLLSGIIPGIIIAIFMSILVYVICKRNPSFRPSWSKNQLGDEGKSITITGRNRSVVLLCYRRYVWRFVFTDSGGNCGSLWHLDHWSHSRGSNMERSMELHQGITSCILHDYVYDNWFCCFWSFT